MGRRSLRQQDRRAQRQRAHDLPRPHDPAQVGDPMEHFAGMQVDLVGHLLAHLDQEPAVHVQHALRTAGRAARVADEQRMLGVEGLRGKRLVRLCLAKLLPVVIAADMPRGIVSRQPTPDDDRSHTGLLGRPVGDLLHRHDLPLAEEPVRGQEHLHAGIGQTRGHRLGPEAAEDRHPDRADLRTRHHRRDGFRRHRQEDADRVARVARRASAGLGPADRSRRGDRRSSTAGRRRPRSPTRRRARPGMRRAHRSTH